MSLSNPNRKVDLEQFQDSLMRLLPVSFARKQLLFFRNTGTSDITMLNMRGHVLGMMVCLFVFTGNMVCCFFCCWRAKLSGYRYIQTTLAENNRPSVIKNNGNVSIV